MGTGSVGGVGPHDEHGGAELAERDREREPGRHAARPRATIGRSTSRHTRARRRAEHRRRLAQARVDGPQHRRHRRAPRTGSRPTPARSGRAHDDAAEVERRLVERDEEPEARRSPRRRRAAARRAASRPRRPRRRRQRDRRAAADDDGDDGGDDGEAQRVADRVERRRRTACCRVELVEGAVEAEAVARRACANERSTSTASGTAEQHRHHREVGADANARAPTRAGRRAVSAARAQATASRAAGPRASCVSSEQQHDRGELHERPAPRRAAGSAAARSGGRSRSRACA